MIWLYCPALVDIAVTLAIGVVNTLATLRRPFIVTFICGQVAISSSANDEVGAPCPVYIAKSTIKNAGLGIFAGTPLKEGENVGFGEPAIPVVDIDFHAGGSRTKEDYHWLLSEYVWRDATVSDDMTAEADQTSAFVAGGGSVPNCHFRLNNAAETPASHDAAWVGRADPGAGAFTPYHDRATYATAPLEAGSELFLDYGANWFLSRESDMGLVPLIKSYPKANRWLKEFSELGEKLRSFSREESGDSLNFSESSLEEAISDLWNIVKQFPYKSRPLSALPDSLAVARRASEVGIQKTELEQSIRSPGYLESNGKCVGNIEPGKSDIPNAGRGAFATKFIRKGGYISIAPLIHIPERNDLTMYAEEHDPETGKEVRDLSNPTGHQLLMNYCFGHRSSSILLCPYGPGVSLINHSRDSPNAKIVWSNDPIFSNSTWLNESVSFFDNIWHAGLAFEYVALADINKGDEIFVDYGQEWQESWTEHVLNWKPPEGAKNYISPQQLNKNQSIPIPTYDEGALIGDEGTVHAWCHFSLESLEDEDDYVYVWQQHDMEAEEHSVKRVIDRTQLQPPDGPYIYTLELDIETEDGEFTAHLVENVPREAIYFQQRKYQSDMFIQGAFRHEMMIPDEMFPAAWKNVAE